MFEYPSHLYGESFFTSFRSLNGRIYYLNSHIDRVLSDVNLYYFNNRFSLTYLNNYFDIRNNVERLLIKKPNNYFRLTFFADKRDGLLPGKIGLCDLNFKINVGELSEKNRMVSLKLVPSPFTSNYIPFKAGSYLQQLNSKQNAQSIGYSDVIFERNNIILESSTSNIIFIKEKDIYVPDGRSIFPGITEKMIKEFTSSSEYSFIKKEISKKELQGFTSAAMINSVSFLTPIEKINNYLYNTNEIIKLKKMFFKYFEESHEF